MFEGGRLFEGCANSKHYGSCNVNLDKLLQINLSIGYTNFLNTLYHADELKSEVSGNKNFVHGL